MSHYLDDFCRGLELIIVDRHGRHAWIRIEVDRPAAMFHDRYDAPRALRHRTREAELAGGILDFRLESGHFLDGKKGRATRGGRCLVAFSKPRREKAGDLAYGGRGKGPERHRRAPQPAANGVT